MLNRKNGFVDKEGKEIIKIKYDEAKNFEEGLAAVQLNGKWGFINKDDKIIIPIIYENASGFSEGLASVRKNGNFGYINKENKQIILSKYESSGSFREGLAQVKLKDKWGFIDKNGKEVIQIIYNNERYFSEGLATVQLNGMWGFINKEGKEIIPIKYDNAYFFNEGIALVELNGKQFYIDKNGTEYWDDHINGNTIQTLQDAQKAFSEGKYLLVLELLKDFPVDDPLYSDAVSLMNKALAYLSSNTNQNFVTVSGSINCGCSKAISGYVVFEDINTKLNVGKCRITSDGYYCIVLPSGKIYSYYIDSKDFYPISRVIDFTSSKQLPNFKDNITIVSYEEMKEQQLSVRINNIFFDFNEAILKPESCLELDRLYKYLNDNPEINVEISGHTDNKGSDDYNITLSNSRANSVKEYLVSMGINSNRIVSKGYGKSKPVATNDTDEGRQFNRRVEFTILKK